MTSLRRAFTLIEMLIVVAVVAFLLGILLPAFSRARSGAQTSRCLSNCRQMELSMSLYSADFKSWYPVMPVPPTVSVWSNQNLYGGVAGLFSLEQVGDGMARCYGGATPGGGAYSDGNTNPLLGSYLEGFGVLTCPADRVDHCPANATGGVPVEYIPANFTYPAGAADTIKHPGTPGKVQDVINYNVSYLYVAGLRAEESDVLTPVPLWGDETDGYDVGPLAWYGAEGNAPGTATAASSYARAPFAGRYGAADNHGKAGANFIFTDGHGAFIKDDVYDTYFRPPSGAKSAQTLNINAIDRFRSTRTQVID